MSNVFTAHLFGRSKRGDREEVRMLLFNPDGSPTDFGSGGGGSPTKMLDLWSSLDNGIPNTAQEIPVPFGDGEQGLVLANEGFDVSVGDTQFDVPAGAYLVQLAPSLAYPDLPPTSGFASVHLYFFYIGDDGNLTEVLANNIEVNTYHDSDGAGDYPFIHSQTRVKQNVAILPKDGYASLSAWSNANVTPLSLSVELILVKL